MTDHFFISCGRSTRVGQTYDFSRYFIPDRTGEDQGPAEGAHYRARRDLQCDCSAAGDQDEGYLFRGRTREVWLSDDSARMVLQLKSRLVFGSLNLFLTSYALSTVPATKTPEN
jgi:hypothetical protein